METSHLTTLDGAVLVAHPDAVRAFGLMWFVAGVVGCAGVGESVAGVCLAVALQATAEVCCEAAVGVVCDGDDGDDDSDDDDDAPAEVPPPEPDPIEAPPPPACRQRALAGGVWRLDCVDGTAAEALVLEAPMDDGTGVVDVPVVDDPSDDASVTLVGLADVARLSGVRGLSGALHVTGPALLSVSLPSLRTIGGDLDVRRTAQLRRLELPALLQVRGELHVVHNRLLAHDPCPALTTAGAVDVAFNDALPTVVVDRLLNLAPPPPSP